MLVVTAPDIAKLHKTLSDMSKRALPHAARNALNTSAFAARRQWAVEGKATMTVRNRWTFGGRHHRVVKARLTKNIRQMQAVTGNMLVYMAEQERGVSRSARGRVGVPIPTTSARVGRSRQRLVRRAYWRNRMRVGKRLQMGGRLRTKSQYIAASIRAAKSSGSTIVYLDLGQTRGLFDVKTKTKMKMVWDMSRKTTRTKANPMLRRTLRHLEPAFPIFHRSALEQQIAFVLKKRGYRVRGPNILAEVARFRDLS